MQEQKTATLTTIFSEVLASLAFMFTDDEPVEVVAGDVWLETTIRYDGSASGELILCCTREFSVVLAANLLGVNPEDTGDHSQADDAVKEFMNIICGQLVTAQHGSDDVFNLTIPVIRELPVTPDLDATNDDNVSALCVEGHPVKLVYNTISPGGQGN